MKGSPNTFPLSLPIAKERTSKNSKEVMVDIINHPYPENKWKILDFLIALVMFIIALNLATQGGWF